MRHINLIALIIAFIFIQVNVLSKTSNSISKELLTSASSLRWMQLKEDRTVNRFLQDAKLIFNLDELSEIKILKTETDKLGWMHHRIQQHYNGIPIEGAKYILHEKDGLVKKANGKLISNFKSSVIKPSMSKQKCIDEVLKQLNAEKYIWEDEQFENSLKTKKQDLYASHYPNPELVYISPQFDENAENYRLAYKMEVNTLEPFEGYIYYIDAHNGELIHKITTIFQCNVGSGQTNYSGMVDITTDFQDNQYKLHNYCLEGGGTGITAKYQDNSRNFCCPYEITNNSNNWTSHKNAVEVFWGTELFYNYMREYHNRISTDGNGELLEANVNVKYPVWCEGDRCWNAYYWLNQAWFSDATPSYGALVTLDVVAHEFTHGLTYKTANLLYQNESGALNESFSDIFGVVVEQLMGPNPNGLDWLIGEDARAIRDMSNPNAFNHPDTYGGRFWYTGSLDNGGVHLNSGVQNYWFYLLAEGGNGVNDKNQSYNVNGIGIVDAAKVAYRNLTTYLTENSDYADAEYGSIQAAMDLFPNDPNKVQQVRNAWCAVGGGGCTNSKSIALNSPNGNEVLLGNKRELITWTTTSLASSEKIIIEFSLNDGGHWNTIDTVTNTGSYNWLVPSLQTNMALVRLTLDGNFSIRDRSDGFFKILSCTLLSKIEIGTTYPQRCVNNTIIFNNATNDINNPGLNSVFYKWKVNGVEESTAFNFQKVFTNSGTKFITLEVNDVNGCLNEHSYLIYIRPDTNANFLWDQQENTYAVDFVADQPDALTYNWTFNGQTIGTEKMFAHNFGSAGNYEVCLSTNAACGLSDNCKNVNVEVPANSCNINANFNTTNQVCANTIINFSSNSTGNPNQFKWYVNGVQESTASSLGYTFQTEGQYTVVLIASNSICQDIKTEIITVFPNATKLEDLPHFMDCNSNSYTIDAGIDMQSYVWTLNNTIKGNEKTLTTFESGAYHLKITDYCGQTNSLTVLVALNDEDCIRPGDMNYDGKVDLDDVIYFGLHYGDCGFARVDQGIHWRNYSGLNWGYTIANLDENVVLDVDLKNVDCNGNGCVDLADWDALRVNWLKEHNNSNNPSIEPIPALEGFNLHLVPNDEATVATAKGELSLILDLNIETDQDYNLPLYAGYVIYDLDDIEQQQIGLINQEPYFSIEDDISWLTDGIIDHVSHQYYDPITKELRIAFTRLDQKNRLGKGRIAQIGIEIVNIDSGIDGTIEFRIEPVELAFFNAIGEKLPLGQRTSVMSSLLWQDDLSCIDEDVQINNTGNSVNYQSVYTTGSITTNGDVEMVNESNVTYSGSEVILNSGFEAKSNSGFEINYRCDDNNRQKEDSENNNTLFINKAIKRNSDTQVEHPVFKTQAQKD